MEEEEEWKIYQFEKWISRWGWPLSFVTSYDFVVDEVSVWVDIVVRHWGGYVDNWGEFVDGIWESRLEKMFLKVISNSLRN